MDIVVRVEGPQRWVLVTGGQAHLLAHRRPVKSTGDPWIDAYLTFRRAWLDGATESELTDLATECRRGLPSPIPPVPAAMFIHADILITSRQSALPAQLVTALWVPKAARAPRALAR
jgi:hypothetical protein